MGGRGGGGGGRRFTSSLEYRDSLRKSLNGMIRRTTIGLVSEIIEPHL